MLNVAGMRIRMSFAAVIVAVAPSVTVIGLIVVGACPTTRVAVVSAVFQVMLSVAGMRMRMSSAAVMVGAPASATVMALIAVAGCPTRKSWFAADAIVGCAICIVRLSLATVLPPGPVTTSCR